MYYGDYVAGGGTLIKQVNCPHTEDKCNAPISNRNERIIPGTLAFASINNVQNLYKR